MGKKGGMSVQVNVIVIVIITAQEGTGKEGKAKQGKKTWKYVLWQTASHRCQRS